MKSNFNKELFWFGNYNVDKYILREVEESKGYDCSNTS